MPAKLRIPITIASVLLAVGSFVAFYLHAVQTAGPEALTKEQKERNAVVYAQRLCDDGDRLAAQGLWDDALARYDQAARYDAHAQEGGPVREKRLEIERHLGAVVWDRDFQPAGARP